MKQLLSDFIDAGCYFCQNQTDQMILSGLIEETNGNPCKDCGYNENAQNNPCPGFLKLKKENKHTQKKPTKLTNAQYAEKPTKLTNTQYAKKHNISKRKASRIRKELKE